MNLDRFVVLFCGIAVTAPFVSPILADDTPSARTSRSHCPQEIQVTAYDVAARIAIDRVATGSLPNLSVEVTNQGKQTIYWGREVDTYECRFDVKDSHGNLVEKTPEGRKYINNSYEENVKFYLSDLLISGESYLKNNHLSKYYYIDPGEYSVPVTVYVNRTPFISVSGLCVDVDPISPGVSASPLDVNFSEINVETCGLAVRASVGRTPEYEAVILALEVQNHRERTAYWGEDWGFFDCRVIVTDAEGKRVKLTPKGEKHWQNIRDEPAEYVPLILQPGDSHTRYLDLAEYCVLPAGTYYVSATFMPNRLREKTIIRISGLQMKVRPPVRPQQGESGNR